MYLVLFLLTLLPFVFAQFGFFDQIFQQQQQQQGHHHQQYSSGNVWAHQSETAPCSAYLCPRTLDCVDKPASCPCPYPEDIKCVVPDGQEKDSATVYCVRGQNECADIERLMEKL